MQPQRDRIQKVLQAATRQEMLAVLGRRRADLRLADISLLCAGA